jgi:tetratricopeptide (TPR) repeat protein
MVKILLPTKTGKAGILLKFAGLTIFCLLLSVSLWPLPGDENPAPVASYARPFGENPYAPSQAQAEFPSFLRPSDFPSAAYCGKCHADVYRQWRESAHANSFRVPFYLNNVQILIDAKGIEYSRHCEGCHNPVALFSGALTKGSVINRSFDEDGVTCMVCHSIRSIQNTSGTGSYVMGKPAVMLNADGSLREGLPSDEDILRHRDLHKKAVMRDIYQTPEFCASCHKAAIPEQLNDYKWLRAFSVYDEWQQSSWSRQSPLVFYKKEQVSTCQSCHMRSVSFKSDYGGRDGKIASHRFPGANTAIPAYYSYPEQAEAVRQLLSDSLSVDFFGLTLRHRGHAQEIASLGSSSFSVAPGDEVTVDLVIQNTRIGHGLVPEQRDFYECWVEFVAKDQAGHVLFHSGELDSSGFLDAKAHSYTNRLIDKSGNRLVHHEIWQTRLKPYDNTIMPGRSDLVRYGFRIPANVRGTIQLQAKVNYRRFRKEYTDFILKNSVRYPVLELGSASFSLRAGKNAAFPAENGQRELLRWNNYGIALLGQQQWWKAAEAFEQTTRLNPDYADGYVNQAIAEYSKWIEARKENPDGPGVFSLDNANAPAEKFNAALALLDRALKINPGYARALFYKGLILRLQNQPDGAVQQLSEVVRQYPNLRQGHQELGYAYYLQKNFHAAVEQFEAVKKINPDDVTACYYLFISYGKLGEVVKAQENAVLYSRHRDDPNNYGLNLDYVQNHAAEANELTPYHVHMNH